MASSASLDELQRKFEENQRRYLAPLANEYRKAGDLDRAIALCEEWLPQIDQSHGRHLSGYVVFGQALYEAGRLPEASHAFATALELDPENLIALRHMGDIARDQHDRVRAREWYERVLDADPRNEEIALVLQALDAPDAHGAPQGYDSERPTYEAPDLSRGASFTASSLEGGDAYTGFAHAEGTASAEAFGAHHDADEAFDPGFFVATPTDELSVPMLADTQTNLPVFALPDAVAEPDTSAGAESPDVHEVDPSELALAAALDAPIVPDPETPAFDSDASFDFQATSLASDDAATDARAGGSLLDADEERGFEHDAFDASSLGAELERADSPEPAYGGGFEAESFFQDDVEVEEAPPAVTPPTDLGFETMEFVPPERDEQPRSGADTASPYVTETMAELYLQQGFRDEALDVYEQLLSANPADDNLRDRVEQLRDGAPSSLGRVTGAYPSVPEPSAAAVAAYEQRGQSEEAAAIDASMREAFELSHHHAAATGPVSVVADEEMSHDAPEAAENEQEVATGPSAREFFAELARRGGESGTSTDAGAESAGQGDEESMLESNAADAWAPPQVEALGEAPDDALSALFSGAPQAAEASADDERAATMLASLVGEGALHGAESSEQEMVGALSGFARSTGTHEAIPPRSPTPAMVPPVGSDARPAARALSLDDVFGADASVRQTPAASFSFDQFFAETATAPTAPSAAAPEPVPEPASPSEPADEAGDLAQFNSWLEGLKKR